MLGLLLLLPHHQLETVPVCEFARPLSSHLQSQAQVPPSPAPALLPSFHFTDWRAWRPAEDRRRQQLSRAIALSQAAMVERRRLATGSTPAPRSGSTTIRAACSCLPTWETVVVEAGARLAVDAHSAAGQICPAYSARHLPHRLLPCLFAALLQSLITLSPSLQLKMGKDKLHVNVVVIGHVDSVRHRSPPRAYSCRPAD